MKFQAIYSSDYFNVSFTALFWKGLEIVIMIKMFICCPSYNYGTAAVENHLISTAKNQYYPKAM